MFNKLSKGSSYFIPQTEKKLEKFAGQQFSFTVKIDKPELVEKTVKVLLTAGAQVGASGAELKVGGDLGQVLGAALKDSDAMYKNDDGSVKTRYGLEGKDVMSLWWMVLNKSVKELQKDKKIEQATMVSEVMKRAIEPAYNYYGVEAQNVADKAVTMTGLLVFYVVYTMWWGYAIFFMFEGLGLSMKKAKVKKEV